MAKVKFGEIVVDMRGKLGGHVHTRNHYGNVVRTRVVPINPQTTAQSTSRNQLKAASVAWRKLTVAQRASWNSFAENYKQQDALGNSIRLTGANLFVMQYKLMTICSETPLTTAPVPSAPVTIATLGCSQAGQTGALTLTFTPAIPATCYAVLEATRQLSPGKKYVKSDFRQIAVLTVADTSPYVCTADYTGVFGRVPYVGEICYFRSYFMDPAYPIKTTKLQSGAMLAQYTP